MAKTQPRKTPSRSVITPRRARSARRASIKTAKVAPVKKISSAPARADQPVKHRAGSKQARVIEMLMKGTTIDDIMKATDWQQHSVRGFLAGVIRRKLKLALTSEPAEAGRIYKVTGNAASTDSKPGKAAA
jgi:hypothetical protein